MGTRADFYTRQNNQMQWLGSVAWDGYPAGIDKKVLEATTLQEFVKETDTFLKSKKSATLPHQGWPWPWEDSRTTDYAYIFENNKVMASCFGSALFDTLKGDSEDVEDKSIDDSSKMNYYFPNMKEIQNVDFGERSGLIIVRSINKEEA